MVIPNSVTSIGDYCFIFSGLMSITIPGSVTSIGERAFASIPLENVEILNPDLWSQISFSEISSNPIYTATTFSVNGSEVKHLDLDINDKPVSPYAFYNAQNLNTIRIKASHIGDLSFNGCDNVSAICLNIESLEENSFANCTNIKTIYCLTDEPPVAPDNAFANYEGVTLYVPKGSLSKYENADTCWWRFLDIIESDFAGIDEIFKADYKVDPAGMDDIAVDRNDSTGEIDFNAPVEVYNLGGMRVADSLDHLSAGIYIVRQGSAVKKLAVK